MKVGDLIYNPAEDLCAIVMDKSDSFPATSWVENLKPFYFYYTKHSRELKLAYFRDKKKQLRDNLMTELYNQLQLIFFQLNQTKYHLYLHE